MPHKVRWSYGVRLLSQADPELVEPSPVAAETELLIDVEETAFSPSSEDQGILHHEPSSLSIDTDGSKTIDTEIHPVHEHEQLKGTSEIYPRTVRSFGRPPPLSSMEASGSGTSSEFGGDEEEDDEDDEGISTHRRRRKFTEPASSWQQSYIRRLRNRTYKLWLKLSDFMTVPLWAALLSLIVACIPPLQHALDEHVQPIKGALAMAGNCSVPVTLVVLGAYFYTPPDPSARPDHRTLPSANLPRERSVSSTSHTSLFDNVRDMFSMKRRTHNRAVANSAPQRPGETKTVIVAVLSRMFITPLLLLPLIALSARFDLQQVFDE